MSRRKVLRTKSWSLESFWTKGRADGTDLWTPFTTVMITQNNLLKWFSCSSYFSSSGRFDLHIDLGQRRQKPPVQVGDELGNANRRRKAGKSSHHKPSINKATLPTVRLLLKKSPCPAKTPTPLHTSQKSRYSRCHCLEHPRPNMAPSVLVDQSEHAPVAVATKSLDRKVIKTSLPNPSLQVTADHRLKSVEAPVYGPGQGEVLVHIKATGICGSDIHFWKTGRIGSLVFEGDCIIGHEASGIVLQCGEGVSHLRPGKDRLCYYHFITTMSGTKIWISS